MSSQHDDREPGDDEAPANLFTHGRSGEALHRSPGADDRATDAREEQGPEIADTSPGKGGQAEDAPDDTASRGEAG